MPTLFGAKQSDIGHFKRVQCRATTLSAQLKELPHSERLKRIKLPSLVYRKGLIDLIGGSPLQLVEGSTRRHSLKLKKYHYWTALMLETFS